LRASCLPTSKLTPTRKSTPIIPLSIPPPGLFTADYQGFTTVLPAGLASSTKTRVPENLNPAAH
jgi:hypothetical protein